MKVLFQCNRKGWSRLAVCTGRGFGRRGCWSLLRVYDTDFYQYSVTDYGGDSELYTAFVCTNCGIETNVRWLPSYVVPRGNRQAAKKRWKTNHEVSRKDIKHV